jgi:ADP-heptose:LPS heptosyltransferase
VRPETIRALDRRLGVPICWVLTQMRRLGRLWRRTPADGPIRSILFIKLVEMGSTVLASRAFELAERRVGRDGMYFLVLKPNRAIVDLMGSFPDSNVFAIRDDTFRHFTVDALRALHRLRKLHLDAAIDMEGFARASAILAYLSRAKRRVGHHRFRSEAPYRGQLLTHELTYNFYQHVSGQFAGLVEALSAPAGETPMLKAPVGDGERAPRPFVPTPDEEAEMRATLARLAGRPVERPIVLLNPNASDLMPLRRWPTEHVIALGRRLLAEQREVTLGITGAPDEREKALGIAADIRTAAADASRVLCLAGETTLRSLLVLYGLADVLVTNDSGPAHFAALTDIDIVSLFGPETAVLYRPLSPRAHCLSAGLACSPCVSVLNHRDSPCRDNRCMQAISVSQVYDVVAQVLERKQAAKTVAV